MKKIKKIRALYFIMFFLAFYIQGYTQCNKSELNFLYTSKGYGEWYKYMEKPNEYHIAIRDNTPDSIKVKIQEHKGTEIDIEKENFYNTDIGIISYYNDSVKEKILQEYLSFYGDTVHSSKSYLPYPGYGKLKPKDKDFTVQIEALYSFTSLLVGGYICSEPVLIDKSTGKKINTNQKKIKEVYCIYQKWLEENKKTNFVNYKLPLEGTNFMWKKPTTYMKMFTGNHLFKPSKEFIDSYMKIDRKKRGTIACTTFY